MKTREELARHYQGLAAHMHWESRRSIQDAERYASQWVWSMREDQYALGDAVRFQDLAASAAATARLLMGVEE